MNISYNWIKDYLKIDYTPEVVAELLTQLGIEVESIETSSSLSNTLEGFVVGEVLSCEKHPNADKLSKTQVNIGNNNLLSVVCGAPNVAKGQKIILASIGACIKQQDNCFEIKKTKIRGEISEGMICSEKELGISDDHSGIMVLDSSAIPGTPAIAYLDKNVDTIFKIDLTPNRIEVANHFGIARELAAVLKTNYNFPNIVDIKSNYKNKIDIVIENTEACKRYAGICIENITIKESPKIIKDRLLAIGLTPINNIVDITNFVLHELGQPLHAFDMDKIAGNKIVIKTLNENTSFTTLDNHQRIISSNDLMICNELEPMCIAGVLGGLNSGISNTTTKVFIESAYFSPSYVRRTSKKFAISTDASYHFERGTDINMVITALKRVIALIQKYEISDTISQIVDIYPNKIENVVFNFDLVKCNNIIGKVIEKNEVLNILKSLEINVLKEVSDNILQVSIPSYKIDLTREIDLVEEVLRIYGFNNVDETEKPSLSFNLNKTNYIDVKVNTVSDLLVANGFYEIMCNSLSNLKFIDETEKAKVVSIYNPLSNDMNVMRQQMLYGGLESIAYNLNRKIYNIKLFEFGRTYHANEKIGDTANINRYYENKHLALWVTGDKNYLNWNMKNYPSDFFYVKSFVKLIFDKFKIEIERLESNVITNLHEYEYVQKYELNSKPLFLIACVSKNVLKKFDIQEKVFYVDIDWDYLLEFFNANNNIKFQAISKFPKVKRDLALCIDKSINYKQLSDAAFETCPQYLKEVHLFDVYEDKTIGDNKISYALSFILEDAEKTMTDIQIDNIMKTLIDTFKVKFGAKLR